MNVGWLGLGKLGLPCALALASKGHSVVGYDPSDKPRKILARQEKPYQEVGLEELLDSAVMYTADSVQKVIKSSDIVFCAVQTPHAPDYGGEDVMPEERVDFEYGYLIQSVREVCTAAAELEKKIILVVVSTVLPGTYNKHLRNLLNPYVDLVYNPFFIAMGTTIRDFLNPEFVLLGSESTESLETIKNLYASVHDKPFAVMNIESAELTKVSYNTFISMKIVFANALMEICQKTGADVDKVIDALSLATDRLISPAYMRGGMGDGGGCHPRDNIAMSWLAQRLNLSVDPFEFVTRSREFQSLYLASLAKSWSEQTGLPVVILGKAYKPEIALTMGSPALLLKNQLDRMKVPIRAHFDPNIDDNGVVAYSDPAVYVVATKHPQFIDLATALIRPGSVIIDPFGFLPDVRGSVLIKVGRKS